MALYWHHLQNFINATLPLLLRVAPSLLVFASRQDVITSYGVTQSDSLSGNLFEVLHADVVLLLAYRPVVRLPAVFI
jgi:hypothetical protein